MSVLECEEQSKQHHLTHGHGQAIRASITDFETSAQEVLKAPKPSDVTRKGYCSAILKISTATVWYTFIKQFILVMQLSISTV